MSVGGTRAPKIIMCILVKNTSLHILMSVVGNADRVKYHCHLSPFSVSGCVFPCTLAECQASRTLIQCWSQTKKNSRYRHVSEIA